MRSYSSYSTSSLTQGDEATQEIDIVDRLHDVEDRWEIIPQVPSIALTTTRKKMTEVKK